jgi:hypothetical protein
VAVDFLPRRMEPIVFPNRTASATVTSIDLLRRMKRMVLFTLLACVGLEVAATFGPATPGLGSLSLIVVLVAAWASIGMVEHHLRQEAARDAVLAEEARLEGARLTANALQDRIANKLSLTAGYCEMIVADSRMPADLKQQAEKALEGAVAAAKTVSELRRLTRQSTSVEGLPAVTIDFERLAAFEPERPRG